MKYRTVKIHARETFAADVTKVIDINIADAISNLVVVVEGTNASDTPTAHLAAGILKLEILDGSDVLYSLDGPEAHALDVYHNKGIVRSGNFDYRDNEVWTLAVGINFGRSLFDPILALDPTRFSNIQLRVQLDMSAGGSAPDASFLTVWANVFDEVSPSLQGFLTAKELKSWTMASTVHEYTDMPTDHPYRGIYIQALLAGTAPITSLSNVKISEDQDKRVPFDLSGADILRVVADEMLPIVEGQKCAAGASATVMYTLPTQGVIATITELLATASDLGMSLVDADGGSIDAISKTSAQDAYLQASGYLPHSTFLLPGGIQSEIGDWFDPRGLGSLRADITGGASAAGKLFLEQMRSY